MSNISTGTLNLVRKDWVKVDMIAGEVDLKAYNHFLDRDATQRDVYEKSNTGLGRAQKVIEGTATPLHTPLQGPELRLSQAQHAARVIFTLEAQEFDLYSKIPELGMEARTAVERKKAQDAADFLLNNAFTTALCATGQSVYNNSHAFAGTTFDNLATAASLSESTLEDMITQVMQQRDAKNQPMLYKGPWYLYHGPALALRAERILGTTNTVGSADNDINVARRYFSLMCDPFVTTTTGYALIPSAANKHGFRKVEKVSMKNIVDTDAEGNISFKKYSIYDIGCVDPYNIIGNAGA